MDLKNIYEVSDYKDIVSHGMVYGLNNSLRVSVKETSKSIVTSALSFMAATIGVGLYSKMEIVSTICMFLARGAIISMLVIIILLPAILSVTFPFIKKTTKNLV